VEEEVAPESAPESAPSLMSQVECYQPPKIVIIVPYRDREEQKKIFETQMKMVLEDLPVESYRIVYVHQCDGRSFNRGAMKNLGFLWVKKTYPYDYKRITLVFQDIDTMPKRKGLFSYQTSPKIVKHFFGYKFALGGIVSITGEDFEKVNGFPNYWAWVYEDNSLHYRVVRAGMEEDRSVFYPIQDTEHILKLSDGNIRVVNRSEFDRYMHEMRYHQTNDGISSLFNISMEEVSDDGMLNIKDFMTPIPENPNTNKIHFLESTSKPFLPRRVGRMRMGGGFI
jgi:hypothetical protein